MLVFKIFFMGKEKHIDISEPKAKFLQLIETAPRVILSTKFGDGKTTFLKEIEADDSIPNASGTKNHKYYFITLHPVNYVVQDNKDVFEIIKRDILSQLLRDSFVFEETKWEQFLERISKKGWRNLLVLKDVFVDIAEDIPGLKTPVKILNRLIKKANDELTEIEKLSAANYISSFTSMKGCIAEDDAITELIYEGIKHVNNVSNRKTVLVIEDLDRIDPAHMFRILNIFAAHIDNPNYDDKDNANKFGFRNVVLVMDYDATKNIFHHFYGKEANYEGYIRKFSTEPPFTFSILDEAKKQVVKLIASTCNISEDSVNCIMGEIYKYSTIKDIKPCSVRDFVHILSIDPQSYVRKDKNIMYKSDFVKMCVYLKIYFSSVGINDIIYGIIIAVKNGNDKFHLLAPLLYCSRLRTNQNIYYDEKRWKYDADSGRLNRSQDNDFDYSYTYNDQYIAKDITAKDRSYIAESIIV